MAQHLFIPDDWKHWIALNVLLGQNHEGLVRILIDKGFPDDLSRLEVQTAASHPYLAAAQSLARQRSKRDWLMHTWRTLENVSGKPSAERRSAITPDEFVSEYYSQNRPVIITDILRRWPAFTKWNREYLKQMLGDCEVEIQAHRNSDPRYELNSKNHRHKIRFSDFLEKIFSAETTNDFCLTTKNSDINAHALAPIWQDTDGLPEYLDPNESISRSFFWMGPAGTVTRLSHDLTNNFMAQVVGRKRVKLISPAHLPVMYNDHHCYSAVDLDAIDFARFPDFRQARVEEIILEPGDLFFLPVGWWHHVTGLDPTITLTFTNFRQDNDFAKFYSTYSTI